MHAMPTWQTAENSLREKLAPFAAMPDGALFDEISPYHRVIVWKNGPELILHMADPREEHPT